MRILLSNDDGILAPGLAALHAVAAEFGETTVVAPSTPQSASSHSITLKTPLVVHRVQVGDGTDAFWGNSVDGRPADCVRLAVRKLLAQWPDLVLSGINAGANVGVNVFYSGTVAAAAEAAMLGIPAVAFSAGYDQAGDEIDYARAGAICRHVLDQLLAAGLQRGDLINVNLPTLKPGWPVGIRVVPQSTAELDDVYHHSVDSSGRETYRLGDNYSFAKHYDDTDVACLADGYVTVTPLHVDMTLHSRLSELAKTRLARPAERLNEQCPRNDCVGLRSFTQTQYPDGIRSVHVLEAADEVPAHARQGRQQAAARVDPGDRKVGGEDARNGRRQRGEAVHRRGDQAEHASLHFGRDGVVDDRGPDNDDQRNRHRVDGQHQEHHPERVDPQHGHEGDPVKNDAPQQQPTASQPASETRQQQRGGDHANRG